MRISLMSKRKKCLKELFERIVARRGWPFSSFSLARGTAYILGLLAKWKTCSN